MPTIEGSSHTQELVGLIEQRKLSDDQARTVQPFLSDLLEAVALEGFDPMTRYKIRRKLGLIRIFPEPSLAKIDNIILPAKSVPLSQRLSGGLTWKDEGALDDFQITQNAGPVALYLAHFNVEMKLTWVNAWAQQNEYEVACVEDALAFGSVASDDMLKHCSPVIVGGSSVLVLGKRCVPCLYVRKSKRQNIVQRIIHLGGSRGRWHRDCRFLLSKHPLET